MLIILKCNFCTLRYENCTLKLYVFKISLNVNLFYMLLILIHLYLFYKLIKKRSLNLKLLQEVVDMLANEQTLPEKYKDHYLAGEYKRI